MNLWIDSNRKNVTALRKELAQVYDSNTTAKRVAQDAGLTVELIDFNGSAISFWNNIINEAIKSKKIDELRSIARNEYPNNIVFQKINIDPDTKVVLISGEQSRTVLWTKIVIVISGFAALAAAGIYAPYRTQPARPNPVPVPDPDPDPKWETLAAGAKYGINAEKISVYKNCDTLPTVVGEYRRGDVIVSSNSDLQSSTINKIQWLRFSGANPGQYLCVHLSDVHLLSR